MVKINHLMILLCSWLIDQVNYDLRGDVVDKESTIHLRGLQNDFDII